MTNRIIVAIVIICLCAIAGCGGGGKGNAAGQSVTGTGQMTISVAWPDSGTRAIPKETTRLDVAVLKNGTTVATHTIALPTTTCTLSVPAGTVKIHAYAKDTSGKLLASGEASVMIEPNSSTPATVTLTPVAPPVDDDAYVIGGSVAPDADHPGWVLITLSALINGTDGKPVTGLTSSNFEVYEDDIRRTPVEVKAMEGSNSKADIAFAIDSTGSMSGAIDGVKDSVTAFVDYLLGKGIDAKLAGVAFWDKVGYDLGGTPPPNLGVFSADLHASASEFKSWVGTLEADGGGDTPEVSVDAIHELNSRVNWRPDAQHIVVAITDATSHQRGDSYDYALWTGQETIAACLAHTVVYTASPGGTRGGSRGPRVWFDNNGAMHTATRDGSVDDQYDISAIASATGGIALQYQHGSLDLTTLPIGSTLVQGYLVRFQADRLGKDHKIRMVVKTGGSYVADQVFTGHY